MAKPNGGRSTKSGRRRARAPRWLRLLGALLRLNLAEDLQYRADLVASVLRSLLWMGTALLTLALFFGHSERLGGWNYWEVAVLVGVFNALSGVVDMVLRPGIGQLAEEVEDGTLDFVLIRPVDALSFVSFRQLDLWGSSDVVLGLGLSAYGLVRLGHIPSVIQVAVFLLAFAAAAVAVYAIWVALMSLAFWFIAVEDLSTLFDALFEGARYPVTAYPRALRFVFVYLLPVAWITNIPASALTGRLGPGVALGAAVIGAGALLLSRRLWRMALRRYAGASG